MIIVVMFEQYDSVYSQKEEGFADALIDSDILTITEDSEKAFNRIINHMEEHPEDLIEYQIQFWLDEQVISNAILGSGVTVEQFNEQKQNILDLVRRSLH